MTLASLKPNSRKVLRALARQSESRPTRISEIAIATDLCHRTIRHHIRYLSTHGYLIVDRPNTGGSYRYIVPLATKVELLNFHD